MTKTYIKPLLYCLIATLTLGSCKKDDQNIFNMFKDVTVDYHSDSPYSVTDFKQVNEGDSVYINFTINSPEKELYSIYLIQAGVTSFSPLQRIDIKADSLRHSYTGVFKLAAVSTVSTGNISKVGPTTFRVCGVDKGGVYVGDGYKKVTVDVLPGFTYYNDRVIFTQDSIEKKTAMFYSITNKMAYNYEEASKRSGEIDFGFYGKVENNSAIDTNKVRRVYLFSPVSNPKNNLFNTDAWTKKGTLFSEVITSGASAFNAVNSAIKLRTDATASSRAYKATPSAGFLSTTPGASYYFKTTDGKYGIIYISELYTHYISTFNTDGIPGAFLTNLNLRYEEMTINVKMER